MNTHASSGEHPQQEPSDLSPRAVLVGAAGVVAVVLLVALLARALTSVPASTGPAGATTSVVRGPRLSSNPEEDISTYERHKHSQLETYGWVDQGHAFARIPIEQAMQKLVTQGSSSQDQR